MVLDETAFGLWLRNRDAEVRIWTYGSLYSVAIINIKHRWKSASAADTDLALALRVAMIDYDAKLQARREEKNDV